MDDLTDDDLAELERLHAKATPGPWEVDTCDDPDELRDDGWYFIWSDHGQVTTHWHSRNSRTNHQLIAATRNALPALLAEVRRLRLALQESDDAKWLLLSAATEALNRLAAARARETDDAT
jgi:hypothetical protein